MEETDILSNVKLVNLCDALQEHFHAWESMLDREGLRSYGFALTLGSHCAQLRMNLCEIFESAWLRSGERDALLPLEQLIERCADLEGKAKEIRNDLAPAVRRTGTGGLRNPSLNGSMM